MKISELLEASAETGKKIKKMRLRRDRIEPRDPAKLRELAAFISAYVGKRQIMTPEGRIRLLWFSSRKKED